MKSATIPVVGTTLLLVVATSAPAHPGLNREIDRLTEAIAQNPQEVTLRIERAYYLRLHEEFARALADLDHARTLDPDNRDINAHRGLTLAALQQDKEAEEELTRFLGTGEGSAATYGARARVRQRTGRHAEALADYGAALKLKGDLDLYVDRGRLQESMGLLDDAAAGYREGLARQGGAVTIRQALIRAEIARREYAAALQLIDEALGGAPVRTHWHLRRAEVFDAAGKAEKTQAEREGALTEANRALKQRPTAMNLLSRAQVLVAQERLEDAKSDLKLALETTPRLAAARKLLEQLETPLVGDQ